MVQPKIEKSPCYNLGVLVMKVDGKCGNDEIDGKGKG